MRRILFSAIVFTLFLIPCLAQDKSSIKYNISETSQKCSANPDSLYNRQKVLQQFAEILNSSIPDYTKPNREEGFHVKGNFTAGFNVYDLTDSSNVNSAITNNCINFINNHIYHVFPVDYAYSFSHLVILENGNLKVFRSINCADRGNKLEDVITYLNQKPMNDKDKDIIIDRVMNYRKYGRYIRTDKYRRLRCKAESSMDNK